MNVSKYRVVAMSALVAVMSLFAFGVSTASADQDTIKAGYDLFMTDSGTTYQDVTMPGDQFGPGCELFDERVFYEGVPFDSFAGETGLLPTDTIVQRLQDAGPVFPAEIDIVIVRLELKAEISVTCNGAAEIWDVVASVPEGDQNQKASKMTIYHHEPDGGAFDSTLLVRPLVTFTQRGGPGVIGPDYFPPLSADPLKFVGENVPWCHTGNPIDEPPPGHRAVEVDGFTSNFFPGIICPDSDHGGTGTAGQRTMCLSPENAMLAEHGIFPAANSQIEEVEVCNVPTPPPPIPTTMPPTGTGGPVDGSRSVTWMVLLLAAGAILTLSGAGWRAVR